MAFHHPIIDRPGETSFHSRFIKLDSMGKALQLWEIALGDLLSPGVQSVPFSLVDHREELLNEVVRFLERWTDLAKGSQILSFDLIQAVRITHKQPDGGASRKRLKTRQGGCCLHFCLLERLQGAVDRAI